MGLHETREVAVYLRSGSLWVGHFVVSDGVLDFGDDRFDATHGLANLVHAESTNSPRQAEAWAQQQQRSADRAAADGATAVPKIDMALDRPRLAA